MENEIRNRAYQLWEEAGMPSDDGIGFWLQAESEFELPRETIQPDSPSFVLLDNDPIPISTFKKVKV